MSEKPYSFVDYKQPNNILADDQRTAYDFGHQNRFSRDIKLVTVGHSLKGFTFASHKTTYNTENLDQFPHKTSISYVNSHDLAAPQEKLQFAKAMFESIRNPSLKATKVCTSYQKEFEEKEIKPEWSKRLAHSCREHDKLEKTIDPTDSSFHKLLDIYASTNVLDYPMYNEKQLNGVSKMDNITVWDWLNVPKARGFRLSGFHPDPQLQRLDKPKISGMVCQSVDVNRVKPNTSKFVPNRGSLTEHQEKFSANTKRDPFSTIERKMNLKVSFIASPSPFTTPEYSQYGSGRPISAAIPQEK